MGKNKTNTMKRKDYFIPLHAIQCVESKRADDPRTGRNKPPLCAAYVAILWQGLERYKADKSFRAFVQREIYRINETQNTVSWKRFPLPVPDALHEELKQTAWSLSVTDDAGKTIAMRLPDLANILFVSMPQELDYSKL